MKLIYLLLLSSPISLAQKGTINWGEFIETKGQMEQVYPLSAEDLFGIRVVVNGTLEYEGDYFATHFNRSQIVEDIEVSVQEKGTTNYYKSSFVLGGNLEVCRVKNKEKEKALVIQSYSRSLERIGNEVEIASYPTDEGGYDDYFVVASSENEEYFAVLWSGVSKNSGKVGFNTKVYNKDFEVIDNSEFDLSFLENVQIKSIMLSNFGELYIATSDPISKYGSPQGNDYSVHFHKLEEDGITTIDIDFGSKQLNGLEIIAEKESSIGIIGSYGESNKSIRGIKGVFYLSLDFIKNIVIEEKFHPFDESFIVSNQSKKERESEIIVGKRFGDISPQFGAYGVLKIKRSPEGSIVGFIEQSWVMSYSSSSAVSYIYENILVFNMEENGDLKWKVVVPKRQVAGIEKGSISSYFSYFAEDEVRIIFNDVKDNYSKKGDYILEGKLRQAGLSVSKNIAIMVSINKENGEMSRNFFDENNSKRIIIPSFCFADYKQGELIFYSVTYPVQKKKSQFGTIKL